MKLSRIFILSLILFILFQIEVGNAGGGITGKVEFKVSSIGSARKAPASRYAKSRAEVKTSSAVNQAVVYIIEAPGTFRSDKIYEMFQRDISLVPHILPILVGSKVDFPNDDKVFHNIFSQSETKSFDLGRYPRGQKKSVTFDKVGLIKVYCDIHSEMSAYILVLKNPYFTLTEPDGSFRIENVPGGTYDLKVWVENEKAEKPTQSVTVSPKGTVTVNFTVQ